MEDGIEITLNDEAISVKGDSREAWPYRRRPRNLQRMGAARQAGEVSIIMSAELLDKLKAYAATDLSRELGGVLLGQLLSDEDGRYILIEGENEARIADTKRASLTFKH